jgi:hypothetical protein
MPFARGLHCLGRLSRDPVFDIVAPKPPQIASLKSRQFAGMHESVNRGVAAVQIIGDFEDRHQVRGGIAI